MNLRIPGSKSDWIKAGPTTCQTIRGEATEAFSHKPLPGFSAQASKQALRNRNAQSDHSLENWYSTIILGTKEACRVYGGVPQRGMVV